MRIYAIGDLHLSQSVEKPMDIFGDNWQDHIKKLQHAWQEAILEDDWVLIAGDISWAMQLNEVLPDLLFLKDLPGRKLLLRGNHDFWWSSRAKVLSVLPQDMFVLQNDSLRLGDFTICGVRGWSCPGATGFSGSDRKIYSRELLRLKLSLETAASDTRKILMMHFPPFNERSQNSGFTDLIEHYGVEMVIYAHLHGAAHKAAFEGERNGVRYIFVASDYLKFRPRLIIS